MADLHASQQLAWSKFPKVCSCHQEDPDASLRLAFKEYMMEESNMIVYVEKKVPEELQ